MKSQHFYSQRGCLSYILWDDTTRLAALVDPSAEIGADVYLQFLKDSCLELAYILETHTHADHVSISGELHSITSAPIARHVLAPSSTKDISLHGGEELTLGTSSIRVLATPGHTNESVSYFTGTELFTGDALLIGGTGRTDFQVGDNEALYNTLHAVLGALPDEIVVRPGHDYKDRNQTTLGIERKTNPRLLLSKSEFIKFMNEYHPPKPELFDIAIPQNSQ